MLPEKVPVKGVKGAGIRAFFLFGVEPARRTVVTHLFLIGGSCCVRFCGKKATIGKQDHPQDVWDHDPVIGIEVHLRVPAENGLGLVASQEKVVS